jgi:hypothetical protein
MDNLNQNTKEPAIPLRMRCPEIYYISIDEIEAESLMSSQICWSIIKHFWSRNMLGFRFQDVVSEFQEKHPAHLTKILADMVDKGML